jgi:2-C-methyl-D-erythritol 4-phosphate cytidylyltransferase
MKVWAIVVAGGSGTRFGGPKQYAELAGRPLVAWAVDAARAACAGVVLVLPAGDAADEPAQWGADAVVAGGATRSASVRAGLEAVPADADVIAVHDAARPLASRSIWRAVVDAVAGGGDAAIPAVPVTDTVKEVGADGTLTTLDRSRLVAVQTPQAFRAAALRGAHADGADATDDAALVEAAGGVVVVVAGSSINLKVTSRADLAVAAALIAEEDLW